MTIHKTVLLNETIEQLNLRQNMIVVDATLGGGGHSREILKKIGEHGTLIAFDRDSEALERFAYLTKEKKNVVLLHENFAQISQELARLEIEKVDAVLADFGISSDQLDTAERGMSFLRAGKLDMRMDQTKGKTAKEIVNEYSKQELISLLQDFGDEKYAKRIVEGIVKAREEKQIETTTELAQLIEKNVPEKYKHQRIHAATRTFQALRMEVNGELESISRFLSGAVDVLKIGGRLAVITFHSGEDMPVKKFFRENARGCICPPELPICSCGIVPKLKIITKKPILPNDEEILQNPRARSAKLYILEKI